MPHKCLTMNWQYDKLLVINVTHLEVDCQADRGIMGSVKPHIKTEETTKHKISAQGK